MRTESLKSEEFCDRPNFKTVNLTRSVQNGMKNLSAMHTEMLELLTFLTPDSK